MSATKARILVVEDFERFLQFLCAALEEAPGCAVVGTATNGLQAVQRAEELHPDVVIMNIGLPGLNGIEAARRIRALSSATRFVFVSVTADTDVVKEALSVGHSGYVLKSSAGNDLLPALEAVLRGVTFISPALGIAVDENPE